MCSLSKVSLAGGEAEKLSTCIQVQYPQWARLKATRILNNEC